jgi:hypothetical protein
MYKFMEVPALGAEIAATDGVVSAGIRGHNMIPVDAQVHPAVAVVAGGHNILHESLFPPTVMIVYFPFLSELGE